MYGKNPASLWNLSRLLTPTSILGCRSGGCKQLPELPEVEVVRRGLSRLLLSRRLVRVRCANVNLRYPWPDFACLSGKKLQEIRRRAKYLIFDFGGETILAWHLGMSGQFHVLDASASQGRNEHACLIFEEGLSLRYRDARRFGFAFLVPRHGLEEHAHFAGLGPEPLGTEFHGDVLVQACRGKKRPIKPMLMDGRVVVGVGNIYASEALFRAGIHPGRPAGRISKQRLMHLADAIRAVLHEAIVAGGSSISDFVHADGRPGYFSRTLKVYGREGMPCLRCQRQIRKMIQAGRSTFYCPGCQH